KSDKESARSRLLMPLLRLSATVALLFFITLISAVTSRTLDWLNYRAIAAWTLRAQPRAQWQPFDYVSEARAEIVKPLLKLATDFGTEPAAVPWLVMGNYPSEASLQSLHVLRETRTATLATFAIIMIGTSLVMSWMLNVNVYSMHGMYRDRLI